MPITRKYVLRLSLLPMFVVGALVTPSAVANQPESQAMTSERPKLAQVDGAALVQKVKVTGQAQRIVIPTANIDLPIVEGIYDAGKQDWTVSKTAANYATITPALNNIEGKTVIYGHATQQVFGRIKGLKQGDEVTVHATNGRAFKYTVTEERNVVPTDVSVFSQLSGEPGLVLITCDGAWSEQRKIIFLRLASTN